MNNTIEAIRKDGRTLQQVCPTVANEWNYQLNDDTPWDIAAKSEKKRWFTCNNGHNFYSKLANRVSLGRSCPYCSNQKVGYGNDFETNYPELAKEWSSRNNKKPSEVIAKGRHSYWWKCENGHEYKQLIKNKVNHGQGCPKCISSKQFSKIEIKLAKLLNAQQHIKIGKWKVDMVINNIVIEYDGSYWHKDKYNIDTKKTNDLINKGYKVIRIRENNHTNQIQLKDIPNAINIHHNYRSDLNLLANDIKDIINQNL